MLFLSTTKYVHVLSAAWVIVRGVSSDRDSDVLRGAFNEGATRLLRA